MAIRSVELSCDHGGLVVSATGAGLLSGADLLVAECYYYDKPVKWHLNYAGLREHLHDLGARRVILTHMSREMLAHAGEIPEECAADGMIVTL